MNPTIKSVAIKLLPPIFLHGLRSATGRSNKWRGNYPDWKSAMAASSGYDAEAIFNTVRKAAADVRDGRALWERDSVCFQHEEYNWQLLACLMTVAARTNGELHVLDFGGALGSTYIQHRKPLGELQQLSWNVVEQSHMVACGKSEFTTDVLTFFDSVEECMSMRPINVVLLSSVLQYLENPYEFLEEMVRRTPAAIIIDRTPLSDKNDRITVQHVPRIIYPASYPCRFLDRSRIEMILTRTGSLSPWFQSPVDPPNFFGVMSLLNAGENKS